VNRREFVCTSAAGLAWLAGAQGEQAANQKKLRVGLIGCGWYGKTDLFRLIQVSPVEVVSLCDVDSRMQADAAELTSQRQASHEKPRTYSDYRKMLVEKDLDIVLVGTPEVLQIGTRRQSSARVRLSGLDGLQPEG
jgi:predicted homoserine dehydrogenase-like protein